MTAISEEKKSFRLRLTVISIIAILIVSSISVFTFLSNDDRNSNETFVRELADGKYMILSGDFIPNRNLMVEMEDNMIISINPSTSSAKYTWIFFDHDVPASKSKTSFTRYAGDQYDTDTPILKLTGISAGCFTVSVEYEDLNGKNIKYNGNIVLVRDIEKEYNWEVGSENYSFIISFSYIDFHNYRIKNVDRSPKSNDYTTFVQNCEIVDRIAQQIKMLNGNGNDVHLANLALSFVQICIKYPPNVSDGGSNTSFIMSPDKYLTGYDNYAFYPLETLFYEMGDCEDTSILTASLFKSLGFETALLMLPGHAMVGIRLDLNISSNPSIYPYELTQGTKNSVTYYICETTSEVYIPTGFVNNTPLYYGQNIVYYLETNTSPRFGIHTIK